MAGTAFNVLGGRMGSYTSYITTDASSYKSFITTDAGSHKGTSQAVRAATGAVPATHTDAHRTA